MNSEKDVSTNPSSIKTKFAIRFIRAMKKLNYQNRHANSPDNNYHMIRDAAYASMACAVGPRRAWSRAVLRKIRNRHSLVMKKSCIRRKRVYARRSPRKGSGCEQENDLRELVPGGEWMDSCSLLYETADYIKCLRAQVQIMTNILHHFTT